ncbi:RICIN domain-containing protein [Nonomuraea diastatica]|uniref:Ricin B lectin domain-containing protein n=1 Tax=Nonomuraea diastatica TaxID=1848329 RepID=A0A4R4VRA6_9ACTN|nr:RICIN domain-containing protein [Nonomuraea diastatica]TDD07721.1 hypothetical protein E1294_48070 [Nonomuraea diastatica]
MKYCPESETDFDASAGYFLDQISHARADIFPASPTKFSASVPQQSRADSGRLPGITCRPGRAPISVILRRAQANSQMSAPAWPVNSQDLGILDHCPVNVRIPPWTTGHSGWILLIGLVRGARMRSGFRRAEWRRCDRGLQPTVAIQAPFTCPGEKMLRKLFACVAAMAAMLLWATPAEAHQASSALASQVIRNKSSRLCLVARGTHGAPIVQTTCDDHFADQKWILRHPWGTSDSRIQIVNVHKNLCLVARGATESDVTLANCNATWADQIWISRGWAHVDYERFTNVNSGLCLAARAGQRAIQTRCGSWGDQLWFPW